MRIVRGVLLLLAGLAALSPSLAGAQTRDEDLPPPPGALERELSLPAAQSDIGPSDQTVLSSPIEIPFILEGGHIIIEASLDGHPPLPFFFDTGARNLITPDVAQGLKAPVERATRMGGIGPKISEAEIIRVDRIDIGAATLRQQSVAVVDIPNTIVDRGSRPRIAGLIGSELLGRYAVTIDYARRTLTLNAPGFRPPSAAFFLPLGFAMLPDGLSHPSVTAELDGIAADFLIDTGASAQVFLSERFQREYAPFSHYGKFLQYLAPGGIGGRTEVEMAFGKSLHLGPLTLSPPVVIGPTDSAGFNMRGSVAGGVLGSGILGQFVVTLDPQSERAYFEPVNGRKLRNVLRGTGMIFDKPDHEAFEVLDVLKGSAAERAGLRPGARVVNVAGHPVRDLGTSDVAVLGSWPAHTSLAIQTSDHRRFDLAIGQILP
jgi:hypothetical protein